MSYHLLKYFAIFLPVVIIVYQLVPRKLRWIVLLAADYIFFWMISGKLLIYLLLATLFAHYVGIWLENVTLSAVGDHKIITKRKKQVLAFGILISLSVLFALKYFNFFGENIFNLVNIFAPGVKYNKINFLVPIGISYYTLQIISYITDVYRGTQPAVHNIGKIALYLSFFPSIMEGPISKYSQIGEDLYSGRKIEYDNLKYGYQRIVWGLFKKIVVADRIAAAVSVVFNNYKDYDGAVILFGAICYTCQLYMEFSGCMDIIIGSGEIFGIKLPENFRQPFLAKDASEFWRRWHITLGTFFKDYIFYPVSLAKPVKNLAKKIKNKCGKTVGKFVAPTIALFCVWVSNGLWHGAKWTYIFYGMYYFVLIFIENITEEPVEKLAKKLHINRSGRIYSAFRRVKLFFIVIIGEMFFRAATLEAGFKMFGRIFSNFHISELFGNLLSLKMDVCDYVIVGIGVIIVTIVGILHEKNINIRTSVSKWIIPARWAFWYAAIVLIIMVGAYGSGYSAVEMIYAGY